ncbi:pyruvate dehydrogenase alpha subunit [Afipia carboxidovorans OM5]|uniref:Pyruvate dehydrogenase E1 component n=1 Tax=Afipia carboxidovorans (strain ATCC 49405 / DSM 1227 / KCTC 32145 / OM5) TaxID=504832 RepID=B6JIF5_AFIC5|nr:transketolase [Afipia carboxidovorans]ACI94199.1 pyruvate dehydrogenase alpha subunit [Afipia carboxidovorans OM5]AEI02150.1 transketolase [Afipia carboxidovorans OM4]AEI05726.1 transketolase [Afipia carboxidovorans OM5]BEV46509.1 transketolase [Afipia carboxidovorans]
MSPAESDKLKMLAELERRILWLASWTIHQANHVREPGEVKVGGHQASSASLATIMTALYFDVLRPQDRVAVKPHASPIFHAIQYLAGNQTIEKLQNFRGLKGAQSYPSRTKDIDDVDFSTGSVGLGVAQTLFSSLVQDYVSAHGWMGERPEGRMVALVGDAEMDEGNIYEALIEGWKHGLRNCWWIVDYNRQSLDAVIREGLWQKFEQMFANFGWDVVILKHGRLQQQAFAEPGGEVLRDWIDRCPNQLYSALTFQGGAAWRKKLLDEIGDQGPVSALIDRRNDAELEALMNNLGGHDMPSLLQAFEAASKHDRPTCFICYTIKGFSLPLAGHKDNHAGLMTPAQLATFQTSVGVRQGHEWDKWEGTAVDPKKLEAFVHAAPFFAQGTRHHSAPSVDVPAQLVVPQNAGKVVSTQMGFGQILNEIARDDSEFASRVVTTSPDVTVSTNLGPWVNRRGLFARDKLADTFKAERIPSTYTWEFGPSGQHLELGIAESNLMIMLSALGLSHSINGVRLLPVGTLYDPFIYRAADQLNYACYQDARFLLAGTPSGITLAPEGGAHQSIGTPLIGMAQDGLCAFEPAFIDELAVIMRFAFDYMQRNGDGDPDETTWLRDQTGGSVYLRLSTRPVEQPVREMTDQLANDIILGAYWMRPPTPNTTVMIAYQGVIAPEAIAAAGLLAEDRRDVAILAVTSADRLNAGAQAAERARQRGNAAATSHIERMLEKLDRNCGIVTVTDGHPLTLSWLGSVQGHRVKALGVEHFGQTGTIADLYHHYNIDTNAIVHAAQAASTGRTVRYLRALST